MKQFVTKKKNQTKKIKIKREAGEVNGEPEVRTPDLYPASTFNTQHTTILPLGLLRYSLNHLFS